MKQWDSWRKYIAGGGKGSWPRDAFEALLDVLDEEKIELIKQWRAECENRWTPRASPSAMNRREAIIYNKCADQLEKLVGEVVEKSKEVNHEKAI